MGAAHAAVRGGARGYRRGTIGAMTATGWPDRNAPAGTEAVASEGMTADATAPVASALADGADPETRHRLRRALRILLAARRRDDGGPARPDDN